MVRLARLLVVAVAVLLCLQGIAAAAAGEPAALANVAIAVAAIGAVWLEWRRSHRERIVESEPLPPGFAPTDEVFVDPTTKRLVRVWVRPATGERRYRQDAASEPHP